MVLIGQVRPHSGAGTRWGDCVSVEVVPLGCIVVVDIVATRSVDARGPGPQLLLPSVVAVHFHRRWWRTAHLCV